MSAIDIAKRVFDIEAEAITHLKQLLDDNFARSVDAILKTQGRLVICGMGKSGLIGKKSWPPWPAPAPRVFSCTQAKPSMAISA